MEREHLADNELAARTQAVDRQLAVADWRKVKELIHKSTNWKGILAVLTGIKPAYILEDGKHSLPIAREITPPELQTKLIITNQELPWFADGQLIADQIRRYPQNFPDADINLLNDKNYITSYLESRITSIVNTDPKEIAKTGLLLGYPHDSVLEFANCHDDSMDRFGRFGYEFSIAKNDKEPFKKQITQLHKKAGLPALLNRNKERLAGKFIESLGAEADAIDILKLNEANFLEAKGVNQEEQVLFKELLLLDKEPDNHNLGILVHTFGVKHNLPYLKGIEKSENGELYRGIRHVEYVEAIADSLEEGYLPYLQLNENRYGFDIDIKTVDKDILCEWVPENLKAEVKRLTQ
jgi:hypothetical protein